MLAEFCDAEMSACLGQGDEVKKVEAKRKDAKPQKLDFDYSKWDSLEREMREDEEEEQTTRMREASQAVRRLGGSAGSCTFEIQGLGFRIRSCCLNLPPGAEVQAEDFSWGRRRGLEISSGCFGLVLLL